VCGAFFLLLLLLFIQSIVVVVIAVVVVVLDNKCSIFRPVRRGLVAINYIVIVVDNFPQISIPFVFFFPCFIHTHTHTHMTEDVGGA